MLVSAGRLVTKTPEPPRSFTPADSWFWNYEIGRRWSAYGELYRCQLWPYVLVSKRARGTARLPLKVYLRDDLNRPEADGHPYQAPPLEPLRGDAGERVERPHGDVVVLAAWRPARHGAGRTRATCPSRPQDG
jgi:hypothetical protein